jgi:hypothetical protein
MKAAAGRAATRQILQAEGVFLFLLQYLIEFFPWQNRTALRASSRAAQHHIIRSFVILARKVLTVTGLTSQKRCDARCPR